MGMHQEVSPSMAKPSTKGQGERFAALVQKLKGKAPAISKSKKQTFGFSR